MRDTGTMGWMEGHGDRGTHGWTDVGNTGNGDLGIWGAAGAALTRPCRYHPRPSCSSPCRGDGDRGGDKANPELRGGDRARRRCHSCAAAGPEPCGAEPCPPRAPNPVRGPAVRQRCPQGGGGGGGGQRDPCSVSLSGAPGPAPQCVPCSAPALDVPGNVCSGAGLSPAGGKGQAWGHISRSCHPLPALESPALSLSPTPASGPPERHHPPPSARAGPAIGHVPGTRAGDTVTLPGYFGEDKSGRRQVRDSGSRRRGGE